MVIPLGILFIRIFLSGELPYLSCSAALTVCYANRRDQKFTMHGLTHFALLCRFERPHLIAKFEYWLQETVFERRLRLKLTNPVLFIWHCVKYFDNQASRHRKMFVMVPE